MAGTPKARSRGKADQRAPQREFEATCPTCGMTADVPAGVEHARCIGCGTVIRLVDHPVPAAPPASVPAAAPAQADRGSLALALGLAGPLVVGLAYGTAHHAIDRPDPDTGTAGLWYLAAVALAAAAVGSQWPAFGPGRVGARAPWGLLVAIPTLALAGIAGTAYEDDGAAWVILGVPLFVVLLVATLVVGLVQRRPGALGEAILVSGAGAALGFGLSAVYMLMTLDQQAAEAREAYETPAWGFFLAVSVLLGLAAHRRRRGA